MRSFAVLCAVLLGCVGCAAFRPENAPPPESRPAAPRAESSPVTSRPTGPRIGLVAIEKKQTLILRGEFEDGELIANAAEVHDPDDEMEVKGVLEALDLRDHIGRVSGLAFTISERSQFKDSGGKDVDPAAIPMGAWVKIEAKVRDGDRELWKLTVRERKPGEEEQLKGRVESVDVGRRRVRIAGVDVTLLDSAEVIWRAKQSEPTAAAVAAAAAESSTVLRPKARPRSVMRLDEEDQRPDDQLMIGDIVTLGGDIKFDSELRRNLDLRNDRDRDRLIHGLTAKLEISVDVSSHVFLFTQLRALDEWVHFDQDQDLNRGEKFEVAEAYVLFDDVPVNGISIEIGRQEFDQGREWVYRDQLDAARLFVNLREAVVELSASTVIFDRTPEEDEIWNYLLGVHTQPADGHELFVYGLHRHGGTTADVARTHTGVSYKGEFGDFTTWFDSALVFGDERGNDVLAVGADVAAMYVFKDVPLEPSVYAGFAYGSGDAHPTEGVDGNFRQTGLQRNNDRFNGLVTFRYFGEAADFELSNMLIFYGGVGFRPVDELSIDVEYHHFQQDQAATFLRDTRLRYDPNGRSRDLGNEWDLIIGYKPSPHWRFELDVAYFHAGFAFTDGDDAWFGLFSATWRF